MPSKQVLPSNMLLVRFFLKHNCIQSTLCLYLINIIANIFHYHESQRVRTHMQKSYGAVNPISSFLLGYFHDYFYSLHWHKYTGANWLLRTNVQFWPVSSLYSSCVRAVKKNCLKIAPWPQHCIYYESRHSFGISCNICSRL